MNWKEQLADYVRRGNSNDAINFVSDEIIEKLIAELEEIRSKVRACESPQGSDAPLTALKAARLIERIDALDVLDEAQQQLRDKWL